MFLFAQSCFLSSQSRIFPVFMPCRTASSYGLIMFDQADSMCPKVVWQRMGHLLCHRHSWSLMVLPPFRHPTDSTLKSLCCFSHRSSTSNSRIEHSLSRWLKKSTSLPSLPQRRDTADSRRSSLAWSRPLFRVWLSSLFWVLIHQLRLCPFQKWVDEQ